MELIDKSALIAKIENKINKIDLNSIEDWRYRLQREHDIEVMKNIISIINTLEVKEVNLESFVRQVIGLYLEAGKHYNSVIKEERKEYGGSDLAIKLLDGVIDAKELSIQYVLDKLKAQKGE